MRGNLSRLDQPGETGLRIGPLNYPWPASAPGLGLPFGKACLSPIIDRFWAGPLQHGVSLGLAA